MINFVVILHLSNETQHQFSKRDVEFFACTILGFKENGKVRNADFSL